MTGHDLLIGIDVGSGGSKVSVIDATGKLLAEGRQSHTSHHDRPGWVEQRPEDWFTSAVTALQQALDPLDTGQRKNVVAMAFSGPHHIAVLLDHDMQPVRPAIMWNDQRSHTESGELLARHGDAIRTLTGNSPAPTWTLPQMHWLRRHEPEALEATQHILFMKDYVRYRFTGAMGTDRIEAQGTLFFDIHRGDWAAELFEEIGLSAHVLPAVGEPDDLAGGLVSELSARFGLRTGLPVITGSADSVTEILAAGVARVGDVAAKLATAGNVVTVADHLPQDDWFLVYEHLVPGRFYWNSATSSAAASLRWFAELALAPAGGISAGQFAQLDNGALDVAPGARGLIFLPFLNGERSPHWDPRLRGSFFGLTSGHSREHLARAVMEGVAYSLRDAASVYSTQLPSSLRLIGGGARSRVWPQIVADVLGRAVELAQHGDSSYGGALVAGVGVGRFEGFEAAADIAVGESLHTEHDPATHERYRELFDLYRRLTHATRPIAHHLADLTDRWDDPRHSQEPS